MEGRLIERCLTGARLNALAQAALFSTVLFYTEWVTIFLPVDKRSLL